ncbi:hypothetical protein GCM10009504_08710 [Pseudomonas laurentiana]|nr:hypothetical protein GCM10009504_08710 [Pseudomonas laurentiana]
MVGEPLMQQAIDAIPQYHKAEEVERLCLLAESLFQAVTDYQLQALGRQKLPLH